MAGDVERELDRRVKLVKGEDPTLTKSQAVAQVLNDSPSLYLAWKDERAAAAGPSLYSAVHKIVHERALDAQWDGEPLYDTVARVLQDDSALRDLYCLCSSPVGKLESSEAIDKILDQSSLSEAISFRTSVRKALGPWSA